MAWVTIRPTSFTINSKERIAMKRKAKRKKSKKYILAIIISVVVTMAILIFLQRLVTPKYATSLTEGAMTAEYYKNSGSNDVIFLGDCEAYETYSPVTLWENYGITSYVRGNSQQMMWQSYYVLADTLKYETPKIVVLSVCDMMHDNPDSTDNSDEREAYNRMCLDGMRWSVNKVQAINASMTSEEKEQSGLWSYFFPILRYHDRIFELTSEDWEYLFKEGPTVTSNGYLMQVGVKSGADANYPVKPLVNYEFSQMNYQYLDKIVDLCSANGITLVLVKSPSLYPIWYDQYEAQIEAYAQSHNLRYINTLETQAEYGLDWATDTYDAGLHLNVDGVEKVTLYVGNILKSEYNLEDHRTDDTLASQWSSKVTEYYATKEALKNEIEN